MKSISSVLCRMLVITMMVLPFSANAGMIGTDTAIAAASSQANRDKVSEFMNRDNVISQLKALGVSGALAQERVDSMTQAEVDKLAGKIDTLPAGAMADGWIIAGIVIILAGIIFGYWGPQRTR